MTTYISLKNTNALIRHVLKESFPGVKFSVRGSSYSGGASTTIEWADGPARALVESVCGVFQAAYFDGGIDYQGSRFALLDGERVSFGADFIHYTRRHSDGVVERAVEIVARDFPDGDITVSKYKSGSLVQYYRGNYHAQQAINRRLSKISSVAAPEKSATLARVVFAGDDGYGQGTVGNLTLPADQRRTNGGYPELH